MQIENKSVNDIQISYTTNFTKNILIPCDEDGNVAYSTNCYGTYGCFISQVTISRASDSKIKIIRLESELLTDPSWTTENWKKFNEEVEAYVKENLDKILNSEENLIPKFIVKFK